MPHLQLSWCKVQGYSYDHAPVCGWYTLTELGESRQGTRKPFQIQWGLNQDPCDIRALLGCRWASGTVFAAPRPEAATGIWEQEHEMSLGRGLQTAGLTAALQKPTPSLVLACLLLITTGSLSARHGAQSVSLSWPTPQGLSSPAALPWDHLLPCSLVHGGAGSPAASWWEACSTRVPRQQMATTRS